MPDEAKTEPTKIDAPKEMAKVIVAGDPPASTTSLQGTSAGFATPQFAITALCVAGGFLGFFLGKVTWEQVTTFVPMVAGAYIGAHAIVDGVARHALGKVLVSHNENRGE